MSGRMVSADEARKAEVDHRGNEIENCGTDLFCLECDVEWPCEPYSLAHTVVQQAEQIAALRALHKPTPVHKYDDVNGVFIYGDDDELVTIHLLCEGCTWDQNLEALGDCEWSEDLDGNVYWPCPTARALGVEL